MKIALIGMSGVGKTYWSKKLKQAGFIRFGCDDMIEKKLENELKKLGYAGINDVAKWMGQPYEPQYPKASSTYVKLEQEVLQEILNTLTTDYTDNEKIIIDTTGSIIYMRDDILSALSKIATIVYFETPESARKELYEQYIQDPKPVIWGDSFQKKYEESPADTVKRCYPELLAARIKKYEKLAHVTIAYDIIKSADFTTEKLITYLTHL